MKINFIKGYQIKLILLRREVRRDGGMLGTTHLNFPAYIVDRAKKVDTTSRDTQGGDRVTLTMVPAINREGRMAESG